MPTDLEGFLYTHGLNHDEVAFVVVNARFMRQKPEAVIKGLLREGIDFDIQVNRQIEVALISAYWEGEAIRYRRPPIGLMSPYADVDERRPAELARFRAEFELFEQNAQSWLRGDSSREGILEVMQARHALETTIPTAAYKVIERKIELDAQSPHAGRKTGYEERQKLTGVLPLWRELYPEVLTIIDARAEAGDRAFRLTRTLVADVPLPGF